MPGIILPNLGINRKAKKVPFADLSGIQRNAKAGWLGCPSDGVTRKVFSAAVHLTNPTVTATANSGSGSLPHATNISTLDTCALSMYGYAPSTSTTGWFDGRMSLDIDDNAPYVAGTPLLRVSGRIVCTANNNPGNPRNTNDGYYTPCISIVHTDGSQYTYNIVPSSDGLDRNIDVTIPSRKSVGVKQIIWRMAINCKNPNYSYSLAVSIPWSAFTWLPTGEALVYQP